MTSRVYILLDVVENKADQVAQTLKNKAGVRIVDVVEGSPNVVVVIQARNRRQLAELTTRILAEVESVTESMQLLPVQDEFNNHTLLKPPPRNSK